jgi:hypothetical protein
MLTLLLLIAVVLLVFAIVGGIALNPLLWILVVAAVVVGAIALLSGRGRSTV